MPGAHPDNDDVEHADNREDGCVDVGVASVAFDVVDVHADDNGAIVGVVVYDGVYDWSG